MSDWQYELNGALRDDVAEKLHPELADRPRVSRSTMDCICGHPVATHPGYAPCMECPCGYGIGEAARDWRLILPSDMAEWARRFEARV